MAASSSDYFTKVGTGTATTLAAPGHTVAGTTFTVVSTSNWPTTTGVIFAVDTVNPATGLRVPGTYTEWEGVVASATTITGAVLRLGTDQAYTAGVNTRVYQPVAASQVNRQVDGLLVSLEETGLLKPAAVQTAIGTGGIVTANYADASITNAKLATTTGELGGAWNPITLAWFSGITIGNGSWTYARSRRIGKTVKIHAVWTFGTSSDVTGEPKFTPPITPAAHYAAYQVLGQATFHDVGTAIYFGKIITDGAGHMTILAEGTGGPHNVQSTWTTTTPYDTANGDYWTFDFEYETT